MEKEENMELLCIEDFKHSEFGSNWGAFDYLLEVARVGNEKLMKKENYSKNKPAGIDDETKREGLVFKYFQNEAVKVESLMEKEAMGFMNLNSGGGLKRKLKSKEGEEEEEEEGLKLKRSAKINVPSFRKDLPENFKEHIINKLGGSDLLLVIQKPLFYSDINPGASRLSIPFSQIQTHEFLNKKEAENLKEKKGMKVSLLDPSLKKTKPTFNRWNMGKSQMYVLNKTWNGVAKTNQLKIDDVVQLWSFRVNSSLCFALVKVNE
ncbi:hypothetical protein REPUB_Repub07fG0150400 [Reevesia pubescens]